LYQHNRFFLLHAMMTTTNDAKMEQRTERAKRKAMIDQELLRLVHDAETEELSEPMEPEAIVALQQAAMTICFVKKYYNVYKDDFIYFPSVTASILDHTLTEEADKYYFEEDDELPMMYGIGLRSVAGIAASKEEDIIDIDYLLPLSMDVDIGEEEQEEDEEEEEEEFAAVPTPVVTVEELPTPAPTESLEVHAKEEAPSAIEVETTEPVDDTENVNNRGEVSKAEEQRAERAKRKTMVDQELHMLVKDAEHEELSEPMEPEAITALKRAAMKICFVKKYYDVFKDDFIYFPSVTASILDHTLTEEADKYYFEEDDELPMMYGIGLRSVAGIAASKEEDIVDIDYLLPLSMDVEIGEEEQEEEEEEFAPVHLAPVVTVEESPTPAPTKSLKVHAAEEEEEEEEEAPTAIEVETTEPVDDTEHVNTVGEVPKAEEQRAERAKRKAMVNQELHMLIQNAEMEELSEPMEPEAVTALKRAAMKICFVKKYYDVFKDDFIYFPSVTASILDHTLTEEADKYYFDEDDELPMMYGIGLRSVAGIAASKEDDIIDIDYLLPLSMDVDIVEKQEEEEDDQASVEPISVEEKASILPVKESPTPTPTAPKPEPEPTIPNDKDTAEEVILSALEQQVAPGEPTFFEEHSPTMEVEESTAPLEVVSISSSVAESSSIPDEAESPVTILPGATTTTTATMISTTNEDMPPDSSKGMDREVEPVVASAEEATISVVVKEDDKDVSPIDEPALQEEKKDENKAPQGTSSEPGMEAPAESLALPTRTVLDTSRKETPKPVVTVEEVTSDAESVASAEKESKPLEPPVHVERQEASTDSKSSSSLLVAFGVGCLVAWLLNRWLSYSNK
jgi:hypothetical protein